MFANYDIKKVKFLCVLGFTLKFYSKIKIVTISIKSFIHFKRYININYQSNTHPTKIHKPFLTRIYIFRNKNFLNTCVLHITPY